MSEISNRRGKSLLGVAPFGVRSWDDADTRTIAVCGELELATASALKREFEDAEAADARVIVLDLRELEFIDSVGLHVILEARRHVGAQLLILKGPECVQRRFELCGLLDRLNFVDEIPAHRAADKAIRGTAGPTADRSTVRPGAARARRANQAALAAAVRELRASRRLRPMR